ncbi:MAG: branched-chain amino acid ABC transporter permease [Thermodesulfobacteriota bacterium]|nr:branched-chain amino acid ABC transporter permease [Thermodesulfobacteriota bacterium]
MRFFQRLRFHELVLIGVLIIFMILGPFLNIAWQKTFIRAFLIMFLCSAFNIGATAGQFNLMIGVAFGSAAYVSTILWREFSFNPWIMFLLGPPIAALFGMIIGIPLFRVKAPLISFAIATLAFNEIVSFGIIGTEYLGGDDGLAFTFMKNDPANFHWITPLPYYYLALSMLVAVVFFCRYLFGSKLGIYFKAIRGNEKAASAAGVHIFKYKMIALLITMALIGFAGNFWAHYKCFVNPESTVNVPFVLDIAVLTVIGGMGTLLGPILSAGILVPILEYAKTYGGLFPGVDTIVYGVAIIAVLLSMKTGIVPWFEGRLLRKHLAQLNYSATPK